MNVCIKYKSKVNELNEIHIKNRVCYYFVDIISGTKINFSNIILNKKLHENISVNNISYKSQAGPKPLCIRFNKIGGSIISLDGKVQNLLFCDYELFDKICDRIKCLISKKSGITNSINYNFGKIKIDSYNSLSI